jgi:hypothetical protein
MRIPKKFKLLGTTYKVVWDDQKMANMNLYGLCDYSRSEITLSTKDGLNNLSKDKILDTFYHERTHAILDMMNERELSANEKFVDVFSKLLRQAVESEKY